MEDCDAWPSSNDTDCVVVALRSCWRLTPQFSGGALTSVTWHFIHDRPLQLLVRRRHTATQNEHSTSWGPYFEATPHVPSVCWLCAAASFLPSLAQVPEGPDWPHGPSPSTANSGASLSLSRSHPPDTAV